MSRPQLKLNKVYKDALIEMGVPYEIRPGKKHMKLFIGDRMVTVLPYGGREEPVGVYQQNTLRVLRAAAKAYRDER